MRKWFLSYNSQDLPLMSKLERALRDKDPLARLFFAPKSLRAGGMWLPELTRAIADATAFLLLVGEKGVGPWQVMEYYEALDRRVKEPEFPVILVLLQGQAAPGLPFLRLLHWVVTPDPSAETSLAQVMEAAAGVSDGAAPSELWRHTAPYRGLEAMTSADTDYFFGRGRQTGEVLDALAAAPDKLPVLLGNSGVGKSSLAQAGVLAALMRQAAPETPANVDAPDDAWSWPKAFDASRRWCFLRLKPGTEPVRTLVKQFLYTWQLEAVDARRAELHEEWVARLMAGKVGLRSLLDATQARYQDELNVPEPPAFLLYVDQGEELYTRAVELERRRFSELVAEALPDPRLHAMMSLRSDFFGDLQRDEALWGAHRQVNVPPLREAELREVVNRPAQLLSARFESPEIAAAIARRAAEDSTRDAGALPLLSYLLDDMWGRMVIAGDGLLRLPTSAVELGGVLVERADAFLAAHASAQEDLRRIFTLKLANVREGEEPTRRRAGRAEFTEAEWRLVSELADNPYRILVTATSEAGETWAEVAHEAVFRRWSKLRDWIAAEREFLSWKTGLDGARRAWEATPEESKDEALLMGAALMHARGWLGKRRADLSQVDQDFIDRSAARDEGARRRMRHARRAQVLVYVLLGCVIAVAAAWHEQKPIAEAWHLSTSVWPFQQTHIRPYVLAERAERDLRPGETFAECAKGSGDCPEMVVVPAGRFTMGVSEAQAKRDPADPLQSPPHEVTIAQPFAVSKYAVTFDEWDACSLHGDCARDIADVYGRGRRPVILVTWQQAKRYTAWLSRMTGKPYRLLTEAEYEYAAGAGAKTAFPWGDDIGRGNANCTACGSKWDGWKTAPVGQFPPNAFGLYDIVGNVYTWVEDCHHRDYNGAPADGSAWTTGPSCDHREFRGGSWDADPAHLRLAFRQVGPASTPALYLGFRVARTLAQGER